MNGEKPAKLVRFDFPRDAASQAIADALNRSNERASSATGDGSVPTSLPSQAVAIPETPPRTDAMCRPFRDIGILVSPMKPARSAAAIFAACQTALLSHLKRVCLWPEKDRNRHWRVGDSSFYIVEFSPAAKTAVYIQFYSEPDEAGAIFEVSSGAYDKQVKEYMSAEKEELLRDRGFEIGGNADNFRKIVSIESAKDLRAVAREAVSILCNVLGYDGMLALRYDLNLQTQVGVYPVIWHMCPYTLEKLMHEWGYSAELQVEAGQPALIKSSTDHGPFQVTFGDPAKRGSNHYRALKLRTSHSSADQAIAYTCADRLNRRLTQVTVTVTRDRTFLIDSQISLCGGVTPEHVRARFDLWRQTVANIATWLAEET